MLTSKTNTAWSTLCMKPVKNKKNFFLFSYNICTVVFTEIKKINIITEQFFFRDFPPLTPTFPFFPAY